MVQRRAQVQYRVPVVLGEECSTAGRRRSALGSPSPGLASGPSAQSKNFSISAKPLLDFHLSDKQPKQTSTTAAEASCMLQSCAPSSLDMFIAADGLVSVLCTSAEAGAGWPALRPGLAAAQLCCSSHSMQAGRQQAHSELVLTLMAVGWPQLLTNLILLPVPLTLGKRLRPLSCSAR